MNLEQEEKKKNDCWLKPDFNLWKIKFYVHCGSVTLELMIAAVDYEFYAWNQWDYSTLLHFITQQMDTEKNAQFSSHLAINNFSVFIYHRACNDTTEDD